MHYWVDTVDNMEGNSDVPSASTFEAQAIGETGGEPATGSVKQKITPFFSVWCSQSSSMMYLVKVWGTVDL